MILEVSGCCAAAWGTEPRLGLVTPAGGAVYNPFKLLKTGGDLIKRNRTYKSTKWKFKQVFFSRSHLSTLMHL